jgi:hypothetical protein
VRTAQKRNFAKMISVRLPFPFPTDSSVRIDLPIHTNESAHLITASDDDQHLTIFSTPISITFKRFRKRAQRIQTTRIQPTLLRRRHIRHILVIRHHVSTYLRHIRSDIVPRTPPPIAIDFDFRFRARINSLDREALVRTGLHRARSERPQHRR